MSFLLRVVPSIPRTIIIPTIRPSHHLLRLRLLPPSRRTAMTAAALPKTMSGIAIERTGGTEVLRWRDDLPVPEPKPDEVLVRNEFAGVNYIDTYYRTGLYPAPHFPYVLGFEGAGTIVRTGWSSSDNDDSNKGGPDRPALAVGDRVAYLAASSYAEYTTAPARHTAALPAAISTEVAAAALLQGLTALTLIREAHPVRRGDWVLVHAAAGGVGLWLCRLLHAVGARVVGTASTAAKRELARQAGATVLVDYQDTAGEGTGPVERAVMAATEGQGVVAVFDGVGRATFDESLRCLGRKGTMVSFGNASGPVPPFTIARLAPKNLRLLRPTLFGYVATREEFDAYAAELWGFLTRDAEPVERPSVHEVYPLREVARAHEDLEGRRTTGKLLLKL